MPYHPIKFTKRKNKSSEEKIGKWAFLIILIYLFNFIYYTNIRLFLVWFIYYKLI
jgi:hypothetical protein